MAIVLGKNIFIYAGSRGTTPVIASAKSCSVSRRCDLIEKASSTQQTSKEFVAGRDEWEVGLDHLITTGAPFEGLLKVGGTYTISIVIGDTRKYGTAICQQADIKGVVGNLGSGVVKFKGSGVLSSGSSPSPAPPAPIIAPIVYGFGSSAQNVYSNGTQIATPTTAEGIYTGTATANGQKFYILTPYDLDTLTTFLMGGVQFLMDAMVVNTFDGTSYKVYKSTVAYNSGTTVSVTASY